MLPTQIGNSMDEAEFTARVVPCVSKLFTSTDRSIRRSLLENIDAYGKHLTQVGSSPQTLMQTCIDNSHAHLPSI